MDGTGLNAGGLRSWLGRGIWSLVDQALFTLSNFILNVLLARALPAPEYGSFALAFTMLLCVGIVHTALITEPMLVYGGRYDAVRCTYLGALLRGHVAFGVVTAVTFGVVAVVLWAATPGFARTLLALAISTPLVLFLWLMRRSCYLRLQSKEAAYAGALYLALMAVTVYVLDWSGALSSEAGLGAMALSSLGAAAWLLRRSNAFRHATRSNPLRQEVGALHRNYARWSLPSGFLAWIPANVFYVLLPVLGLIEASAVVRALMNFVTPAVQSMAAMSTLLLPALARARGESGFGRLIRSSLYVFLGGALLYWMLVGIMHRPLVHALYNGRYDENAALLWVLGGVLVAVGLASVAGAALRALERPDIAFRAHLVAATVTLSVGTCMAIAYGLRGAVVSILLGWTILAVYLAVALVRSSRSWKSHQEAEGTQQSA